MDVRIKPARLLGEIDAIPSKSYAQRIILAAALADRPTNIYMSMLSKDIKACMKAVEAMGAQTEMIKGGIRVTPGEIPEELSVFSEESGTTARLILPILTAVSKKGSLNGAGSLLSRPFRDLCECISEHGVSFSSHNLPISYTGSPAAGEYKIAGDKSSQYISGLMFALPLLDGNSKITLTSPLQSAGYANITKQVLEDFNINSSYEDEIAGNQKYISPSDITVEGDWSNASYWLTAGIVPKGLNESSLQKDALFKTVCDSDEIDMTEIPDLVSALAVYATQKKSSTTLYNIERLKIKESNRVSSVCDMIRSIGGEIQSDDKKIVIMPSQITGGTVDSHNDHRIVMAAAVASHFSSGDIIIKGAEAVDKSYPDFFKHFMWLGGIYNVL